MARTAQIFVLFLIAVCTVQSSSSSRHYSNGRSHGRHHNPRDHYSRHRSHHGNDNSKRNDNSLRLHVPTVANPEDPVSTPTPNLLSDKVPIINVSGKLGGDKPDNGKHINLGGSSSASSDDVPKAETITVEGNSPNSDVHIDLPFGNDNNIKSVDIKDNSKSIKVDEANPSNINDSKPNNVEHITIINPGTINIDGANPRDVDSLKTNSVDHISNINPGSININGANSSVIDNLKLNDVDHVSNINPGTINIGDNSSNDNINEQNNDTSYIHVDGRLPNGNDKYNNDDVLDESDRKSSHKADHEGVKSDFRSNKDNRNVNKNLSSVIEDKNKNHGIEKINALTPAVKEPNTHEFPANVNKIPGHPTNGHLFPDVSDNKPKHDDNTIIINGLLPGDEDKYPKHVIANINNNDFTSSGKPSDNKNVDKSKPNGHQPDKHDLNRNGLPTGGDVEVQVVLPNKNKPILPSGTDARKTIQPHFLGHDELPKENKLPGKVDNGEENKRVNNSFMLPVYLNPGSNDQIRLPNSITSQSNKVAPYYIVMNNGQATLVKNPVAALSGSTEDIDINSILGQDLSKLFSLSNLASNNGINTNWLQRGDSGFGVQPVVIGGSYPNIAGFNIGNRLPSGSFILNGLLPNVNMPSLISNEQPVNIQPVISEPVSVAQPVIAEQVPISQPIYTIPIPSAINPSGPYGYPNMPYPYPWPSMWDSMHPSMNWPNLVEILLGLKNSNPVTEHPNTSYGSTPVPTVKTPHVTVKIPQPTESTPPPIIITPSPNEWPFDTEKSHTSRPHIINTPHPTEYTPPPFVIPDKYTPPPFIISDKDNAIFATVRTPQPTVNTPLPTEDTPPPVFINTPSPTERNTPSPTERNTPSPTERNTPSPTERNTPFVTVRTPQTTTNSPLPTERINPPIIIITHSPTENNTPFATARTPEPTVNTPLLTESTIPSVIINTPSPTERNTSYATVRTPQPNTSPDTETIVDPEFNRRTSTEKPRQPITGNPGKVDLTHNKDFIGYPDYNGNGIGIPSGGGISNDESQVSSGPYDPTLINLLNVVLKLPNRGSHTKINLKPNRDDINNYHANDHYSNDHHPNDHYTNVHHPNGHYTNDHYPNDHNTNDQHPNDHYTNDHHPIDHNTKDHHPNDHHAIDHHANEHHPNEHKTNDHHPNDYHTNRNSNNPDQYINDLLAILKSNAGNKPIKDLLEDLKSKPGDKAIKDLVEILKSKPEDKTIKDLIKILNSKPIDKPLKDVLAALKANAGDKHMQDLLAILKTPTGDKIFKDLLAILNENGNINELNPNIIGQPFPVNLLDGYGQPNMNVLVQPGMDDSTRSTLMLLLNLLANNLGNEYSPGIGGYGNYYERINPANLYFLGHFPCDYSNINGIGGGQGLQRSLWQLLSHRYGLGNAIRLERSAKKGDDTKLSTPAPVPVPKDKKNIES